MTDPPGAPSALAIEAVAARELSTAEAAGHAARQRAAQVESEAGNLITRVRELERSLAAAREEARALEGRLAEAERGRRLAEQRAQAESEIGATIERERAARADAAPPDPAPQRKPPANLPAPPEPESPHATRPWLASVFKDLVATDPISAGRLVLALLPAQGLVGRPSLAYDLILGELVCVRVTVRDGTTEVEFGERARTPREVQFQVDGGLAALARLLAAGPVRRRFARGLAKVRGERAGPAALRELTGAPLSLHRLHTAGVRLDPGLGLAVCARVIDPAWTLGERFTIAHQPAGARAPGTYLEICDGRPLKRHAHPPAGEPDATIVGPGEGLLPALAGARSESLFARGAERPLALMARWLERAQSG